MASHVVLVGLSGTGKSTVAPLVASQLNAYSVVDTDREVEKQAGQSVAELFERDGEATFRTFEAAALAEALNGRPAVIATGGGVVLGRDNRQALKGADRVVIWLRAHPDELVQRLTDTPEARPLLHGDPNFAIQRLASERDALYSEVADYVIDTDGAHPRVVAEDIIALLATRSDVELQPGTITE